MWYDREQDNTILSNIFKIVYWILVYYEMLWSGKVKCSAMQCFVEYGTILQYTIHHALYTILSTFQTILLYNTLYYTTWYDTTLHGIMHYNATYIRHAQTWAIWSDLEGSDIKSGFRSPQVIGIRVNQKTYGNLAGSKRGRIAYIRKLKKQTLMLHLLVFTRLVSCILRCCSLVWLGTSDSELMDGSPRLVEPWSMIVFLGNGLDISLSINEPMVSNWNDVRVGDIVQTFADFV